MNVKVLHKLDNCADHERRGHKSVVSLMYGFLLLSEVLQAELHMREGGIHGDAQVEG